MTKEAQIAEIIENFNFTKVHRVMKFLNWRWGVDNTIPTIGQIVVQAYEKLNACWDDYRNKAIEEHETYFQSSGGLEASVDSRGLLSLKFILEEWLMEEDDKD